MLRTLNFVGVVINSTFRKYTKKLVKPLLILISVALLLLLLYLQILTYIGRINEEYLKKNKKEKEGSLWSDTFWKGKYFGYCSQEWSKSNLNIYWTNI